MVRGGIGFDLAAKTAMVEEQPLPFTRSEYAISEYLALHAGQTFSKEQIYEAVFGYDGTADDTAVTQHIKNIRAKLRTAGVAAPETVLKTIWGVGYQWKSEPDPAAQCAGALPCGVRRWKHCDPAGVVGAVYVAYTQWVLLPPVTGAQVCSEARDYAATATVETLTPTPLTRCAAMPYYRPGQRMCCKPT